MADALNSRRVSLSLAYTSGVISLICALLLAIAPELTTKVFGSVFHGIDISSIAVAMTWGSAISGIIVAMVFGFVAGWLFAGIYNKLK